MSAVYLADRGRSATNSVLHTNSRGCSFTPPMVEARGEPGEECHSENEEKSHTENIQSSNDRISKLDYRMIPNTMPIIFLPCVNPAYSYCYGGKQTLKEIYFGKKNFTYK